MGDIVASSTTDTQESLNACVQPDALEPRHPEDSLKVESTTDKPSDVEFVESAGRSKSSYQKRIDRLVKEREQWKSKYEEAIRAPGPAEAPVEVPQQDGPSDVDALKHALSAYLRTRPDGEVIASELTRDHALLNEVLLSGRELPARIEEISQRAMAREAEKLQDYEARQAEARERHPDFDDVGFKDVPVYSGIIEMIKSHPQGIELQYLLGSDPALARELIDMPPELAMGKAGAILESLGSPRRVTVASTPPPPIRPVSGSPYRSASRLDDPDIDFQTFKRLREPQEKAWRSGLGR